MKLGSRLSDTAYFCLIISNNGGASLSNVCNTIQILILIFEINDKIYKMSQFDQKNKKEKRKKRKKKKKKRKIKKYLYIYKKRRKN